MSRNPPLFGDVLSAEERVLGCMCDSFRLWAGTKKNLLLRNMILSMILSWFFITANFSVRQKFHFNTIREL